MMSEISNRQKNKRYRTFIEITIIVLIISLGIFYELVYEQLELMGITIPETFNNIIINTIGKFFNIINLIESYYIQIFETIAILIMVWMINRVFQFIYGVATSKMNDNTMTILIKSFAKYAIFIVGIVLALNSWGVDSTTILASFGVVGVALGFGAQSLVADVIAGLFILIESQFLVGDIIVVDGFRGKVKEIGLRTTKIEDPINEDVKIINNSDIRTLLNQSVNLSLAKCEVGIEYSEDVSRVEKILCKKLPQIKKAHKAIKAGPYFKGVQKLDDSCVTLLITAKVEEHNRLRVNRILNREIKACFDEHGIGIPFPQLVITEAQDQTENLIDNENE